MAADWAAGAHLATYPVTAWAFELTVTYPGDSPATETYPTLTRATEIMAWVIDSPTNLAPEVSIKRVLVTA